MLLHLVVAPWDLAVIFPVYLPLTDARSIEDFNESFVAAWKTTHNFKQLRCETNEVLDSIPVG